MTAPAPDPREESWARLAAALARNHTLHESHEWYLSTSQRDLIEQMVRENAPDWACDDDLDPDADLARLDRVVDLAAARLDK